MELLHGWLSPLQLRMRLMSRCAEKMIADGRVIQDSQIGSVTPTSYMQWPRAYSLMLHYHESWGLYVIIIELFCLQYIFHTLLKAERLASPLLQLPPFTKVTSLFSAKALILAHKRWADYMTHWCLPQWHDMKCLKISIPLTHVTSLPTKANSLPVN